MNAREKFNAVMNFEPGAPAPKVETSYWYSCIEDFVSQGLPVIEPLPPAKVKNVVFRGGPVATSREGDDFCEKNVKAYFGLDSHFAKFPFDISPQLPKKIISETDDDIRYTDSWGRRIYAKKNDATLVFHETFPIETLEDFEKFKELYDTDWSKRLLPNWDELVKEWKTRDYPIRLGGNPFGFYGTCRELLGDENLMCAFYEEPELIHSINRFYLDMIKEYWALFLKDVEMDMVMIYEDMTYNRGNMISNEMFREFQAPYYEEIIDFFHQYGIKNIIVDSDGYVEDLIPELVRVGVTGMYPFEIYPGNDLLRIRENYPKLQMFGGINKRVLMTPYFNKQGIDEELSKVPILLRQGGFIPHIDHSVSEGVTFENFKYYRTRLNEIIDEETKI